MAVSLRFECQLISPFHTTRRGYSNLYACAPWIMGSTLRGATLYHLIQRHCPHQCFVRLQADNPGHHSVCSGDCGAQALFDENGTARFSFGEFISDLSRPFRTKIGIRRDTWSSAEAALLTYDVCPPGARFQFWVRLPEGVAPAIVEGAVVLAGEFGIGRFRSQGFGRYRVTACEPSAPPPPRASGRWLQCRLAAPYVLPCLDAASGGHQAQVAFGVQALRRDLVGLFGTDWVTTYLGEGSAELTALQATDTEYVGRWCYEDGQRHTRQVVQGGARFELPLAATPPDADLCELAWGLGEWRHSGFGALGPSSPSP
jgi:hypothetical protein